MVRINYLLITLGYTVYIKKDYKSEMWRSPQRRRFFRYKPWLFVLGGGCLTLFFYVAGPMGKRKPLLNEELPLPAGSMHPHAATTDDTPLSYSISTVTGIHGNRQAITPPAAGIASVPWQTLKIQRGDNLSLIFERMGLRPVIVQQIMALGRDTAILRHLIPNQTLYFQIDGKSRLLALKYEPDLTTTLQITERDGAFTSEVVVTELEKRIKKVEAVINNSLFIAGQNAGLSDNLIMRLVAIYAWDIDFALAIRAGDRFRIIYEEQYKDGEKVGEGPILAAEFINRGKQYRAVRYTSPKGRSDYYSDTGFSMRKAFLRTPVKFSRISSRFSWRRKHPILNTIRAHKGVDYAAPTGTPIKATGEGTVIFAGRKGGYGKTVILKHGGIYSTLYAHMSRYGKGMKRGKHIKQGQVIGYVGMTGSATGPHLHYEFRVNGVHRNPLTVKLPKAARIPGNLMAHFKAQTALLLARLDTPIQTEIVSNPPSSPKAMVIARQHTNISTVSRN